jgi:translation initiation factor IF-2
MIYDGELASLKRYQDDAKEVIVGQECGLNIKNFNDIKEGDIVEAYKIDEIKRTLKDVK